MPRRDDDDDNNVIPFRRRPRKWTRPEDFGHEPGKARKSPKGGPPKKPRPDRNVLAAWTTIAAIVAATVAWHFWA